MNQETTLSEMEKFFLALSDKTRLRILNLLREDEVCVCYFTEVLGESQPKISRHLAYLRSAGIVSARKDGKWVHYKIAFPENRFAANLLDDTLEWLASQAEMREDYKKLENVCCAPPSPVTISRAPVPKIFAEAKTSSENKGELDTFLL